MAFKNIFDEARKKLTSYFGLGQAGLGTFGQQVKNAVRPVANFTRQNPTPFSYAQRQLTPTFQRTTNAFRQVARPVANFVRQNPTPYRFVQRQAPQVAQQVNRRVIRPTVNLYNQATRTPNYQRFVNNPVTRNVRALTSPEPSQTKARLKLARDYVVRPFFRGTGEIANTALGRTNTTPRLGAVGKQLYGDKPVGNLQERYKFNENYLKGAGLGKASIPLALIGTAAAVGGDITPMYGGGKGKLAQSLTKIDDVAKIKKLTGVADDVAKKIAKSTKADEIGKLLSTNKGVGAKLPMGEKKIELINKSRKIDQKLPVSLKAGRADIPSTKPQVNAAGRLEKSFDDNIPLPEYKGQDVRPQTYEPTPDDWRFVNPSPDKFRGGLQEQAEYMRLSYENLAAEREIYDNLLGKDVISDVKKLVNSKAGQKADFDPTKIKGFDEIAQMIRDFRDQPNMSDNEALDIITKLPTWAEVKATKPPVLKPIDIGGTKLLNVRGRNAGEKGIKVRLKSNEGVNRPTVRGGITPPDLKFGNWKDKSALALSRETLDRNIDAVAGKEAPKVKQFITEPIKANETARAEFLNQARKEIGQTVKNLKIKVGSLDDKLVQRFGEGRITLDELKKTTPNWNNVANASEQFRGKYDQLLDLVNAKRTEFGYEPIPKRQDYFRHFQEIGSAINKIGVIGKQNELPTSISGITDIFKPGKPFSTAELQRRGGEFTESAVKGMDNYLDSVSKQIFHMDSVQRSRALEQYVRFAAEEGKADLPNFVANLAEYGNLIAGKKSKLDRAFESIFGRKLYTVANTIRSRTSANMIGGNISSALTNFIPFTQSLATTSKTSAARGLYESAISPLGKDFAEIGGIKSSFLTRRYPANKIAMTSWEKAGSAANWLFESVDKFTAKAVTAGKYYENLKAGMNAQEAMKVADDYAAKVLADRSWGQLPNLMGTKTLGPITQFQTEINNMWSFITKDIPQFSGGNKLKLASQLGQFAIYSYLFNNLYQNVTGRKPTIDPINGILTVAGVNEEGEGKPIGKRLSLAAKDIGENLPFVGGITGGRLPISAGIPNPFAIASGESTIGKELMKPAYYLAPPFGGGQAKKTIEGLKAYFKGASTNDSGKVRYPIEKNTINAIKTGLFGQYATPESREYFNKERKPLGDQQSEIFKLGGGKDYYNKIMGDREASRQADKELEALKSGKKTQAQDLGEGIYQLSNGKFYLKDEDKTLDNENKVKLHFFEKQYGEDSTNKAQYSLDYQRAKRSNDIDKYMELSQSRYDYLENYKKLLDPKEDAKKLISIANEQDDILYYMQKYAGYGGFTKGRSGKGKKLPKFEGFSTATTSGLKIPIMQAKKMTIKAPSATPKIAIKSIKPKQITKSSLASMR